VFGNSGKINAIELEYNGTVRMANVVFGTIVKAARLELLPVAKVGDYVLVHAGVAIIIVNEEEAVRTFEYLQAIKEIDELKGDT
jgi:hydrogenase expression/formation protein HypC